MPEKFGIGIVGAGMAAKPHMKSFQDLADEVEIRGVYSRRPETRAAFCSEWGVPEAPSIDAMLADPALDGLLMMTPPNAREEIAAKAAAAGKHILMEKPVERTTEAAKRIVDRCDEAGVTLGVVFQHRFRAGSLALQRLIQDGKLGRLASAYLVVPWWRPQSYYDEPGRGTYARDGGGVLISQAIHSMDLLLSLAGPVASVQAMAGKSGLQTFEAEDFVGGGMRFANGANGALIATVTRYPGEAEFMALNFENASTKITGGTLEVDWRDGRSETFGETTSTGGGADPMDFPHDWHKAMITDFLNAARLGRQPQSNGHTALEVHKLIDALIMSSNEGRRIDLEQPL